MHQDRPNSQRLNLKLESPISYNLSSQGRQIEYLKRIPQLHTFDNIPGIKDLGKLLAKLQGAAQ